MPRRSILIFAGACIAIAAALAVVTMVLVGRQPSAPISAEVTSTGQPQVGGPFQLVNEEGQPVDETLLNGKWSLVFFGFTYCPDFCPTTLSMLEATKARLGDQADDVQLIFISVDPARDTPKAMKDYLSTYPMDVVGLTGTPEQVRAAADAYRVLYEKVGEGENYTMNHSLTIYLMGPDGKFRAPLGHDIGPARAADIIKRNMARG
ncbi:SCO family protein [Brevundimonas sp. M20]|uniref:SCO family protein n=1 Tax=Brevundimonas sp. M20 TaxID=2591463 RepID=UPI0011478CCC|nr:SCO family protein [Brevundimonas sp. M20]QDH72238.1 SCO family protein [Brevundimonas sp. M20]